MRRLTLNIVGCGAVATSVAKLLHDTGQCEVVDLFSRRLASAKAAAQTIGGGRACEAISDMRPAQLWMIGVPDRAIAATSEAIAGARVDVADCIAFHFSGSLGAAALAALAACGAACASAHPAATFPQLHPRTSLSGIVVALEGDALATGLLRALFTALGANAISIQTENKLLYHAGAVFASNFVTTLIAASLESYAAAGVSREQALEIIGPLIRDAVSAALSLWPEDALTGPIQRGDIQLVRDQVQQVTHEAPELAALYRVLVAGTARLARKDDPLGDQKVL